ncbi:glycoside hydrolase, partial [Streptomyces fradiae]
MNRRRRVTIAITAVCALTVLAAPAHAAPAPTPVPPGASAAPQPRKSLEEVRAEIEALYRQAASATDAYNLAEEQAKRQSAEIVKLGDDPEGDLVRAFHRDHGIPLTAIPQPAGTK